MLMAVNEPYALMVQPDDILISPREVDEHFGTMVCFHPRYALGDHHNYMDKDDFLREMYLDTVGHDEAGMKRYERIGTFHLLNLLQMADIGQPAVLQHRGQIRGKLRGQCGILTINPIFIGILFSGHIYLQNFEFH